MGWQGEVRKRSELERVAQHFGVSWQDVRIRCWRGDHFYWIGIKDGPFLRYERSTLEHRPLKDLMSPRRRGSGA